MTYEMMKVLQSLAALQKITIVTVSDFARYSKMINNVYS